jgi:hypothetical protein
MEKKWKKRRDSRNGMIDLIPNGLEGWMIG